MTDTPKKRPTRATSRKNKTKGVRSSPAKTVATEAQTSKAVNVITPLPDTHFNEPKWERMEDEELEEFKLFTTYRMLGPLRSLSKLYIDETRHKGLEPGPISEQRRAIQRYEAMAQLYRWHERVDAYEMACLDEERAILEQRLKDERNQRYDMITKSREKLLEFIEALDPNIHEIRPHELLKLASIINADSREEFEKPIQEEAKLKAKAQTAETNNLAGLLGLALQHANQQALEQKRQDPGNPVKSLTDMVTVDAEFHEVKP